MGMSSTWCCEERGQIVNGHVGNLDQSLAWNFAGGPEVRYSTSIETVVGNSDCGNYTQNSTDQRIQ